MVRNKVWLVLGLAVTAGLLALPLITHAPNRLVSGRRIFLPEAASSSHLWLVAAGLALVLLIAAWLRPSRPLALSISICALAGALVTLCAAGLAAHDLASGASPIARTSPASGLFLAVAGFLLAARDALTRAGAGHVVQTGLFLILVLAAVLLTMAGLFDEISLMKEYAPRRATFATEALRHLQISLGALVIAVALGLGLGVLIHRQSGAGGTVLGLLNIVQVVPAIALFALLMAPLGWLSQTVPALRSAGIAGIGPAPAMIALVLYLLLPIVNAVSSGFAQVSPAAREAATGLGFSPRQRLTKIEIPLAAPVILSGIRVAAVQAIGLATLAALIGGGGLGTFVFQGMGQFALDLVLLGVLPIAVLAILADAILRLGERALSPEGAG